jgi:hypothetical protein
MADAKKRKLGGGTFFKRLIILALLIWVVTNPLGAATTAHNIAYWIGSFFA